MSYTDYLLYAKAGGFQPVNESAFNALVKAGFVFTELGLTIKGL